MDMSHHIFQVPSSTLTNIYDGKQFIGKPNVFVKLNQDLAFDKNKHVTLITSSVYNVRYDLSYSPPLRLQSYKFIMHIH